jgi:polyferredoxin
MMRFPQLLPASLSSLLTLALLSVVQIKAAPSLLVVDRFLPGWGWLEIMLLSAYAFWLTHLFLRTTQTSRLRLQLWLFFSVVVFLQLLLGLLGLSDFLMSARAHLPIPALILSGPIFRGTIIFMPFLFLGTLLLVGPAWCSYLCYLGAWDNLAATRTEKPMSLPAWTKGVRWFIFLATILLPVGLKSFGSSTLLAISVALGFGVIGLLVMGIVSTRMGVLSHCLVYCPISLLTNVLGKVSLFRMRIAPTCNDCLACSSSCRFQALEPDMIQKRQVGITCTLCGDCVSTCTHNSLHYRFLNFSPQVSRIIFVVMIITLHTIFLGLAKL